MTHGDRVFAVEVFNAEDDVAAIRFASERYRSGIGKSYEIWQEARLVHVQMLALA
jgi:hypothetical protein